MTSEPPRGEGGPTPAQATSPSSGPSAGQPPGWPSHQASYPYADPANGAERQPGQAYQQPQYDQQAYQQPQYDQQAYQQPQYQQQPQYEQQPQYQQHPQYQQQPQYQQHPQYQQPQYDQQAYQQPQYQQPGYETYQQSPASSQPYQASYPAQQAQAPSYPQPEQYEPYERPYAQQPFSSGPSRPTYEPPLPDAPRDAATSQWGQPSSSAAPAPRIRRRPLSRLAVATAVVGVLGGAGVSLVLGAVALLRIRRTHRRGARLAIIGMVVGTLWGVGAATVYLEVLRSPTVRDAQGVVVNRGDVSVTDLRTGDCIEQWTATNAVGHVTLVPCESSHDAQVFSTFTAAGGTAFPGNATLSTQSSAQCLAKARTALRTADAKTAKVAFFTPVASGWSAGQKQVDCVVVLPAPLTRSVLA